MGEWIYRFTFAWPRHQSASRPGRFTVRENQISTRHEAGWAPEPVWTTWISGNSWPYRESNSDPSVIRPLASHYTDCVTAALARYKECYEKLKDNFCSSLYLNRALVSQVLSVIFILGFCILLRVLYEGYWKNRPSQQLFKVFILYLIYFCRHMFRPGRLSGLVVRVLGYRSGGPGSIPGTTRKKTSGSGTGSTQPREYNWGATW
jgi:hypothetical protein